MTSSADLIDFKQANIPSLLAKLDELTDIPPDLLPKKDDLSNRIDTVSRLLDDQLNERIKFEETANNCKILLTSVLIS
ncbi:hypothetical protein KIN20_037110 [Parelaphostrongylus tenuis]|uniref:Uncharacterized protein n=1 Tax=Parelaphostrongylus tenuis TaxID=148309 RepID=A0AAD5RDT3_PARTN|nr:hypothetical protein KIN20_037110 [Parelaphostrongylus tenuis]